jgi:hypothetical protein
LLFIFDFDVSADDRFARTKGQVAETALERMEKSRKSLERTLVCGHAANAERNAD